jgi:hypothetical protein
MRLKNKIAIVVGAGQSPGEGLGNGRFRKRPRPLDAFPALGGALPAVWANSGIAPGRVSSAGGWLGLFLRRRARQDAMGRQRGRHQTSVLVERFQDSARVKAWRSADEFDYLLKLRWAKLRYNLFDAVLVEQQDSRNHILGHAFSGGPAHLLRVEIETEAIGHGAGT